MNTRLLLAGSVRMMARYKLRTFFMSIGVAVGVGSLVAGRALGTGAEREIRDKVNRMFGPGTMLIMARATRANQNGRITTLKLEDLEAVEERLDQVVAWDPTVGIGACEIQVGDTHREATIFGHSEHAELVWNRDVVEGRFFDSGDLAAAARVAVIGTRMSKVLFDDASPIGRQMFVNSLPFQIVGVLEAIGIDPHGEDRDLDIFVPTTTAMRRLRNVDYIGSAKIVVRDPEAVDEDADRVREILRERHKIVAGQPDDFAIYTSKFAGTKARGANRVLKLYVPAAAGVVLLLATIVIANIMLAAVRQRVAEIGLRKAVGATEAHIHLQFLAEAVGVTVASGVVGLAVGSAGVTIVGQMMRHPVAITADAIVVGFVAAVVTGILSGIVPARRAARLDPVRALR